MCGRFLPVFVLFVRRVRRARVRGVGRAGYMHSSPAGHVPFTSTTSGIGFSRVRCGCTMFSFVFPGMG